MTEDDFVDMTEAMRRLGGGFVKALAECFAKADYPNRVILLKAFPGYVAEYQDLAQRQKAREKK